MTDGLGHQIPVDAFENDPGVPGAPRLDASGLKAFNEETAAQAARIKKLMANKKGEA